MRAIVHDKTTTYDASHAEPQPAEGECVVQVHLAGICSTDLQIIKGYMGFTGVLGHEMVGTVISGPPDLAGRRVACEINCVCGACDMCSAGLSTHCRKRTVMGIAGRDGCFADRVAIPPRNCHLIPDVVSDEEAVFVEPLAAAWQIVRQVPIEARMRVAVVGSGRLGLLAAQVLKTCGCKLDVIGRNSRTLEFCEKKHIQATHVDDVVARGEHDVVVECSGSPAGLTLAQQLVRPRGTIVLKSTYHVAPDTPPVDMAPCVIHEVTLVGSRCGTFSDAVNALAAKTIDVTSMITARFDLADGIQALEAAASPENIKVLLKVNPQ